MRRHLCQRKPYPVMGTRRKPPAIRPPAYASAYAPRVRPLQKAQRLGWSVILGTWPMSCRPAPPLPLKLPHAVCSGPRSGALVLHPVLLCDPPNGRSALSLPLPPRTATLLPFAPRGQYAERGSAARPDTLPVFMLWHARLCSVCPAPCLAVCSRRVLRPAVCSHQTGARRQPPAHTTAARLGPAACSALSAGQGYSAEAARPARASRRPSAPAAPCARANGESVFHRLYLAISLVPCAVACGKAQKRRSSQGSRRAAEPPLTGPAPLCRRANKAGAAPAPRGFSRHCSFWRCLLCFVSSLQVPVRSRIMPGLPPIWTGCCLAVCLPWRSSVVDAPPALML